MTATWIVFVLCFYIYRHFRSFNFMLSRRKESNDDASRRRNVSRDTEEWFLFSSFFSSAFRSHYKRDLTRLACFSHIREEIRLVFRRAVLPASNRTTGAFHIAAAPALGSITDLGIKSTAGRCRHSQYGSSRCGLVIAWTRTDVCPDDFAIWWSTSIIGSPTRRDGDCKRVPWDSWILSW